MAIILHTPMETTECPTALLEILTENQTVTPAIILLLKGDYLLIYLDSKLFLFLKYRIY